MRMRVLFVAAVAGAALFATSASGALTLDIFSVAGGDAHGFAGDGGPATSASLDGPAGVAVSQDGTIFIADTINQRIRRVDPSGRISTFAGSGKRGDTGDGGPAKSASFQDPTAIALGADGSMYVADTGNSRLRVIHADGTIATLAGTADQGFSGDGGPSTAAQVNGPAGVTADLSGRIFFSDTGNNRVREIGTDGLIHTIAGTGQAGSAGDGGPATSAQLSSPAGLALEPDGSLLIADSGNNRIRRVAPDGTISTVAGNGGGGSGGDGAPATSAQLNDPVDVSAVPAGGFFVAEQQGDRIRHVDQNGNIARLAGTGGPRFGGDGRPAATSLLNAPRAVELMASGKELLVADTDNNRIRYIAIPGQATHLAVAPIKTSTELPLVKKTITVNKRKRRTLTVTDVPIVTRVSREATLTLRLATKKGKPVTTFKSHVGPGAGGIHLPRRMRSGRHRLAKDHYVLRVTATSGSAIATSVLALVVH